MEFRNLWPPMWLLWDYRTWGMPSKRKPNVAAMAWVGSSGHSSCRTSWAGRLPPWTANQLPVSRRPLIGLGRGLEVTRTLPYLLFCYLKLYLLCFQPCLLDAWWGGYACMPAFPSGNPLKVSWRVKQTQFGGCCPISL